MHNFPYHNVSMDWFIRDGPHGCSIHQQGREGAQTKREYIWVLGGRVAWLGRRWDIQKHLDTKFLFQLVLARRLHTFRRDNVWSTLDGAGEDGEKQEEAQRETEGERGREIRDECEE